MRMPHPGDMQHRIVIGNTVNTINENGYPEEMDETVCTVWAAIEDASGRWFNGADAENVRREIRYVIRWRGDVKEGMWVLFGDRKRTITEIGEYDFKRRYMQLTTEDVEGVM